MSDSIVSDFHTSRGYQILRWQGGQLTSSMEDYLEMIYRICAKNGYTRIGKLSAILHIKPSSASKMICKLTDMGYLRYSRYEIIQMTESGKKVGSYLLSRHNTTEKFLEFIGSQNAFRETELIEHSLSPETVDKLHKLLEFFRVNPDVRNSFEQYIASSKKIGKTPVP
jgi:Mn-dependent DtxR family transcriptional regulator